MLINPYRRWSEDARPIPDNVRLVTHYEPGYYDLAILHVDQQSIYDPLRDERWAYLAKGRLYKEVNELIQDIPKVVINHMTPFHDHIETDEVVSIMKEMVGDNYMIVNSNEARRQWGWGHTVLHGLDPNEWWDLPKEPRCITVLSRAGMEKAYRRIFLETTARILKDMKVPFFWVGVDKTFNSWDAYRNFIGRSLVFFFPAWQSPRPRARTEAQLCLKGGSKVILSDFSCKNIEDTVITDTVLGADGKAKQVFNVHKIVKEMDTVTLSVSGHEKLVSSGDHKFLAVRTGKTVEKNGAFCKPFSKDKYLRDKFNSLPLEWVRARDLQKMDCIVGPADFSFDGSGYLDLSDFDCKYIDKRDGYIRWKGSKNNLPAVCNEFGINYNYAKTRLRTRNYKGDKIQKFVSWLCAGNYEKIGYIKQKIEITASLARLFGYYIAEGYTQKSTIKFCFHKDEVVYQQDVIRLLKDVFGIDAVVRYRSNNRGVVVANNQMVARVFDKFCGVGAINKIIPKELLVDNDDILINLLAGLYRGDGHLGNEANYTTISEKLAYQVYFILKRFDIHGSAVVTEASTDNNRNNKMRYAIRSYGSHFKQIKKIVNDLSFDNVEHKNHSYFKYGDYWYYPVKDIIIKTAKEQTFYDLTVEDHSYLVNGLATHNSGSCIVTTPYQDADTFIEDGVNGFLTSRYKIEDPRIMDNPQRNAELIRELVLDKPDLAVQIGQAGKKTAIELFNFEAFEDQWRKVISDIGIKL